MKQLVESKLSDESVVKVSQHNLFGDVDEINVSVERVKRSTTNPVKLDRREVFGGGYKVSKRAKVETLVIDVVMAKIENVLSLKPLVRNGVWCRDAYNAPKYNLTHKVKYYGEQPVGSLNAFQRELRLSSALAMARSALDETYEGGSDNFIVKHAMELLWMRLHHALPEEDLMSICIAFIEVAAQSDFIDNTQKGENIRSITRRDQMRVLRAKERMQKAKERGEEITLDQALSMAKHRVKRYGADKDDSLEAQRGSNSDSDFTIDDDCAISDAAIEKLACNSKHVDSMVDDPFSDFLNDDMCED